jgi:hypothetical protein
MTELATTLKQIEKVGERVIGFQDGRRYDDILKEMKNIKNVGKENSIFVKAVIGKYDGEMNRMKETYGENCVWEYQEQRSRLIKQLENSKELELKEMELDYLAPSNNE